MFRLFFLLALFQPMGLRLGLDTLFICMLSDSEIMNEKLDQCELTRRIE